MFGNLKVDYSLLPPLMALLEEKHVSGAARRLYITQSAASKKLAQLRDLFKDPLLIRVDNHYVLSPLAEKLYPQVRNLFLQAENVLHFQPFDPSTDELDIQFATVDFYAMEKLPSIIPHILARCPGLTMTVHQWSRLNMQQLLFGEIHCALTDLDAAEIPDCFNSVKLNNCRPVCLIRKDHPLAGQPLDEASFLRSGHICHHFGEMSVNYLDAYLEKRGLARNIVYRCQSVRACCSLCARTDLILSTVGPIAETYAREFGLAIYPIPFPIPEYADYLIWHKRFDDNPRHRWFRETFAGSYAKTAVPAR